MNIKDRIIKLDITIKDAMGIMDRLRISTLFVTDEDDRLIGCVTDGDIRRAILKQVPINENISKAINCSPMVITDRDFIKKDQIREKMIQSMINHVPLVSNDKKIMAIYHLSQFTDIENPHYEPKSAPIIIMAGGEGTRLGPLTGILPKALAPLGNKPVLQKIIENFKSYGFNNFKISINYMAEMIKTYCDYIKAGGNITFIDEDKLAGQKLGTIGSLALIKEELDEPFFVSNCDILIDANYNEVLKFHNNCGNVMTIIGALRNTKIPYGVLTIATGGVLKSIDEKPEFDHLINTGMYVLNPEAVKLIPAGERFDMTALINKLTKQKLKVGVFPIRANQWFDIGQWKEYGETLQNVENQEFTFKQG